MQPYRPGQTLDEAGKSHQRAMSVFFNKNQILTEIENATSVETFIQKKKQNEPFYKSSRKKSWE